MSRFIGLFSLLIFFLFSLEWSPVMRALPEGEFDWMRDIISDDSGRIWFSGSKEVVSYDPRTGEWTGPIPADLTGYLSKDKNGNIWIIGGLGSGGLFTQFFNDSGFSEVWNVAEGLGSPYGGFTYTADSSGGFWVGMVWNIAVGAGIIYINYFDGYRWTGPELLCDKSVEDWGLNMLSDNLGRVWIIWTHCPEEGFGTYARYYLDGKWSDTLILDNEKGLLLHTFTPDAKGGFWSIYAAWATPYVAAQYFDGEKWSGGVYSKHVNICGEANHARYAPDRDRGFWVVRDEEPQEEGKNIWCIYFDFIKKEWSEPEIVETCPDPEGWNNWPATTVDREGRLWVAWQGERYGERGVWMRHTLGPGIEETKERRDLSLFLNSSPNPFSSSTLIQYSLSKPSLVSLKIYSASGQLIKTLVDDEIGEPGTYTIEWDGRDARGRRVSAGVYFYRLRAEGFTATKRLVLIR